MVDELRMEVVVPLYHEVVGEGRCHDVELVVGKDDVVPDEAPAAKLVINKKTNNSSRENEWPCILKMEVTTGEKKSKNKPALPPKRVREGSEDDQQQSR